jgi:hypothetical protein
VTVHRTTAGFWRCHAELPEEVKALVDKNFELLKSDPKHPSLHFKPVGRYWSARVGKGWRAVALPSAAGFDWFWIGSHDEYSRLIK